MTVLSKDLKNILESHNISKEDFSVLFVDDIADVVVLKIKTYNLPKFGLKVNPADLAPIDSEMHVHIYVQRIADDKFQVTIYDADGFVKKFKQHELDLLPLIALDLIFAKKFNTE